MYSFINSPKNPLAAFAAAGFFDLILVRNDRAVCLALPNVLPFILRDKRKYLENNVAEESPDQIFAAARV